MKRLAALALLASSCAHAPERGTTLPAGQWGGDQVALEISPDGLGRITMSCAEAEFAGPVKLDVGGHFLTSGSYTRGTGVATTEPPVAVPATISGRLDPGGVLWLDVATRDSYPVRSARLQRGVPGKLLRCL
jgi:hypothetical protein